MPSRIPLTSAIARAAGHDAGNRNMRAAGRTAWNEDDWNAAALEFERLWPQQIQASSTLSPAERKALKQELRYLDSLVEAAQADAVLKRQDEADWRGGARRYGKCIDGVVYSHMRPRNSGPRHRIASEAQSRVRAIKERMAEIRQALKGQGR